MKPAKLAIPAALAALLLPGAALAAAGSPGPNASAIAIFLAFVGITLLITWWAARRTSSASDFYTAGGGLSGFQNGLAIAGDYMSAATLLGISSIAYFRGYDALPFAVGFFIGWPIVLFLLAERLRNLGRFTVADIISYRLDETRMRILTALGSLTVVLFYMIVQVVGAGQLIQLLFGLDYKYAVFIVGALMVVYVMFGGMIATSWVQIIKATLLLAGGTVMLLLTMQHFDFSLGQMLRDVVTASKQGAAILEPGRMLSDPISTISLSLGMMFGIAGLPHILMRFFTVTNAKEARRSVFYATGFVGYFFLIVVVMGLAAIVIVGGNPVYFVDGNLSGALLGGSNMVIMHLANAVGGNLLLGFMSAVAFATILAVVSGLALAGASAISHDLYAMVLRRGRANEQSEIRVSKIATLCIGLAAIVLGLVFENINVAFMTALAFGVAASSNFPVLILAMSWKGLTTRGALWGGLTGLVVAVALVILSPAVWQSVLGFPAAIFPYEHPALFSMPLAFLVCYVVSRLDRSAGIAREREGFERQFIQAQTGFGINEAARH
ncbi:cation/acetate symporter ActP [Kerstersia gyiorum]|uniref:cation/acetate symporter ActP n=1 Tax=Kerstersia gyiorum TaxID=206506 RepID=UPI00209D75FE|nr:cation/acetate symporter ActP [Kerstersia gyiorum]MCP1636486.1 cation/acetate symporter [Kerstersia gyiorum]MCP1670261.1 cation/acetate symporter [Kerstersia gyiorum]MCP1680018.1 cation/acetate symporter [Kerstersia gyiorum]MCP1708168.1 cation/acetate symporter [Kerstersia gyiorum]MCP1824520.1 cation/acetate symporter [Kerstersia gyiorum]